MVFGSAAGSVLRRRALTGLRLPRRLRIYHVEACQGRHVEQRQVCGNKMIDEPLILEVQRDGELEGVESSQPRRKSIPGDEMLRGFKMIAGQRVRPKRTGGDIEHETRAQGERRLSIQNTRAHLHREGRLGLNDAEN